MDLSGIQNEAEFFPAGTLSDALQDELREITARWSKSAELDNPLDRLSRTAAPYLTILRQVRNSHDRERRADLRRTATHQIVSALGYDYHRSALPTALDDEPLVPILGHVADVEGRDVVWLLEAPLEGPGDEASDPLGASFTKEQFPEDERDFAETKHAIEEVLGDGIFGLRNGPRYVLIFALSQIVLVDRHKWPMRSVLRFDLQDIFSRQDQDTLAVIACLISREARVPRQGIPIADRIEDEAQRNANAVTTSLKRTVRDAIEILGQEMLDVAGGKYPTGPRQGVWIDGPELSIECLRFMYRLLFLFYAEANPRLNILNLRDPIYASGYSIEALRELESVRLRTPTDKAGTYLWESLQRTLTLLYDGTGTALRLPAVKVSLLDPEQTPILNSVRLRNEAVQKMIRLLSLKQSRQGTGRISYAKLGIGQLGAVYETLISFTGVVAKQDLIELRPQTGRGTSPSENEDQDSEETKSEEVDEDDGETVEYIEEGDEASRRDKVDLLAPSYFVPRSRISEFRREEIVFDGAEARIYNKGSFIYRLAGRDREKSASYYTPEPLARLLVKHALMERCKDLTADEILELKILEPAMGSAAFLVETTNQFADLYLERKQRETGKTIPQDQILLEKQKVRSFIADRNCFGVDLNPIAVELGAISLWLNSLHASEFSPWFGDQLHAGNSLIGARRASYSPTLMTAKKRAELWFHERPQEIGWKCRLPEGHIWQWLLPARDMAKFDKDKSIREFASDAQERIKAWRKSGFFETLAPHEVKLVQKLSRIAEELFDIVADDLAKSRASVNDAITLWPDKLMPGAQRLDFREKDRRNSKLIGADHASNTLPYKRLKTAMDAWCALWLWPLDKADLLPNRTEFLHGMAMILEGGFMPDGSLAAPSMSEFADPAPDFLDRLEPEAPAKDLLQAAKKRQASLFRETDVDALVQEVAWLGVAVDVAARARFTHFDLIFADVLRARGGFDVIVGNPPWAKPSWNEGDVIGDIDPGFICRQLSAPEARYARSGVLAKEANRTTFLEAYAAAKGAMTVTGSAVMNPFAGGGQNNLYRCFIDLGFRLVAPAGYVALIHQDGHLTDPKSAAFRREWYTRIVKHFEFINRMKTRNFAEVDHNVRFSVNIYRGRKNSISFENLTNAFVPAQVEDCYRHDGAGPLPMIKTPEGEWDTHGHRNRIVRVELDSLAAIHALTESDEFPVEEARFIQPYSAEMLNVFRAMAAVPSLAEAIESVTRTISTPEGERNAQVPGWQMSGIWHESASQKAGILRRETRFYNDPAAMVISGPMFHVGNPFYKTPKAVCRTSADYEVIDLRSIPDDYLPRINYAPAVEMREYLSQLPSSRWEVTKTQVDFYRVAFRRRINLNSERSLTPSVLPRGFAHIDSIESVCFKDERDLLSSIGLIFALPFDYLVKAFGQGDFREATLGAFPFVDPKDTAKHRALRLVCSTTAYADLWNGHARSLSPLPWHSTDPRLALEGVVHGPTIWDRTAALRSDFARRMALVEIDVMVAQALDLTLDQLIDIYRIYFPVMQQYEAGTWYDRSGRIAWTCSKGLPSVGYLEDGRSPSRRRWEQILESGQTRLECEAVIDFLPGGPHTVTRTFEGPFDTCDRVEDYKRAWAYFATHKAKAEAA
jgi:hypothetical protein